MAQQVGVGGRVRGPDGSPIAGASVALFAPGEIVPQSQVSGADGTFFLPATEGDYSFSVSHEGSLSRTQSVHVAGRENLEVVLEPGGRLYRGEIVSESIHKYPTVAFWTRKAPRVGVAVMPKPDGTITAWLPDDGYILLVGGDTTLSSTVSVVPDRPFETRAETTAFASEDAPAGQVTATVKARLTAFDEALKTFVSSVPLQGSRVVWGVGESTHGSAEAYRLRLGLVRELLRSQSVSIALEANWADVHAAAEYIDRGIGDPDSIAGKMEFYMWRTREFAAMLREFRALNRRSRFKISLTGVDVQNARANWKVVKRCSVLSDEDDLRWQRLTDSRPSHDDLLAAQRAMHSLREEQPSRRPRTSCGPRRLDEGLNVLAQWIDMAVASDPFTRRHLRDGAMAENVLALARATTVVVWAHNNHVARRGVDGAIPMGATLAATSAIRYIPIGMVAADGTFNARRSDDKSMFVAELRNSTSAFIAQRLAVLSAQPLLITHSAVDSMPTEVGAWLARPGLVFEVGGEFMSLEASTEFRVPFFDFESLAFFPTLSPSAVYPDLRAPGAK